MEKISLSLSVFAKLLVPIYGFHLLLRLPLIAFILIAPHKIDEGLFKFYFMFSGYLLLLISTKAASSLYRKQPFKWINILQFSAKKYGKFLMFGLLFSAISHLGSLVLTNLEAIAGTLFIFPISIPLLVIVFYSVFTILAGSFLSLPILLLENTSIWKTWSRSWSMVSGKIKWWQLKYSLTFPIIFWIAFMLIFNSESSSFKRPDTRAAKWSENYQAFGKILNCKKTFIFINPTILFTPIFTTFITTVYFKRKKEMERFPKPNYPVPASG